MNVKYPASFSARVLREGMPRAASMLAAVAGLATAVYAAPTVYTYTAPNSGATNIWSSGTGWTGALAPVSATDTTLVFGGSFSYTQTSTSKNDLTPGTPFQLNAMTLSASNSSNYTTVTYNISANAGTNTLNFTNDGATTAVVNLNSSKGLYSNNVNFNVGLNATIDGGLLTFQGNGSNGFNYSGILSDGATAANVTKTGTSALTLSGANTFTGGVALSQGTLNINNAKALGATAGTFTMASGVKIDNTSGGAITNSQNNAQVWNGDFTWGGSNALNLGTGAVTLAGNSIITLGGTTGTLTVGGVISDGANSYSLTMGTVGSKNTGTLILTGTANAYDGGTFINSGFLQIAAATSLGGSGANVTVNSGGALATGYALDQAALGRLTTNSAGTIGLAADSANNLDFSAAGANLSVSLGAIGNRTYSGILTPHGTTYRLGGAGGNLIMATALTGANNLVIGSGGSSGTVTLNTAGTYSGGTTVAGVSGSTASVLQTNILTGVSNTPFGSSSSAITLNNGTLGFGTAATLASGNVMNVTGYDVTFDTGTIKLQVGSGASVTYAANSLNQSSLGGVLYIAPTSSTSLGTTEKVFVTNTSSSIPLTVTNGMIAPNIIDFTNKTFLTYDAVNGFSAAATTTEYGANNVVSVTTNPNAAVSAYAFRTSAALGVGDNLTLGAGGFLSTGSQNNANGTINFGSTPGYFGIFGGGSSSTAINATAGVTFYGTGMGLNRSGYNIVGGITFASGAWSFTPQPTGSETFQTANPNALIILSGASITQSQGSKMTFASIEGSGAINETAGQAFNLMINGLNSTATTTFSGSITGALGGTGNIIKAGTNTQVFAGSNTYNGTTAISGGVLRGTQTSGTPFGVGSVTIGAGVLSVAPSGSGANVVLAGANAATNSTFSYNAGAQLNLDKGSNTSLAYTVGNSAALSNSVLVRGTNGTLIITPASGTAALGTATGEKFIVNGGVATTNGIASASIIGQDSNANKDGTFLAYNAINGFTATGVYSDTDFNSPNFANVEDITSAGYANLPTTTVFALRTAGALSIASGQTLTIGGIGASVGGVILNGGSINGGTLAFAALPGVIYSNLVGGNIGSVITGSGGVSFVGPGVTTLTGTNTYSSTIINNSTVSVANVATNIGGNVTLNGGTLKTTATGSTNKTFSLNVGQTSPGGTFDVASGTTLTLSGVVSGGGSLTKANTGTLIVSAVNTYTGGTVINDGTLVYANSFTMKGANSISVAASGVAGTDYATVTSTAGALTFGGTLGINITASLAGGETFNLFTATTGSLLGDFGTTAGNVSVSGGYLASLTNDGSGLWTGADTNGSGFSFTFATSGINAGIFTVSTVPEPATYAAIFGLLALGGAACRRRRTVR